MTNSHIYFHAVVSIYLSILFFLAWSQRQHIGCLPYFYTWRSPSANLECRSEMYCMRLAANTGRKKSCKKSPSGHIAQLCRAISSQLKQKHESTIGKNLLSSNMSSRCPHNMVNFDPLAAEIGLVVWGTPTNFNGFRVLAALLHGSQVSVSQTL